MNPLKTALTVSFLTLAPMGLAHGQLEVSVGHLRQPITYIKTAYDAHAFFEGETPEVLPPVVFDCPGPRHSLCTVQVELVVQFSTVTGVAGAVLLFDGLQENIHPLPWIGMDSTSSNGGTNTRLAVWTIPNVKKGWHAVRVFLFVEPFPDLTPGFANAFNPTIKVQVLRN